MRLLQQGAAAAAAAAACSGVPQQGVPGTQVLPGIEKRRHLRLMLRQQAGSSDTSSPDPPLLLRDLCHRAQQPRKREQGALLFNRHDQATHGGERALLWA